MPAKRLNNILKEYNGLLSLLIAIISLLTTVWMIYGYLYGMREMLVTVQKNTLKNTITNSELSMEERLNACDVYIDLGYNSATSKKCYSLYEDY